MSFVRHFAMSDVDPPWATGFLLAAIADAVYEDELDARRRRYALLEFDEQETLFHRLARIGNLEASILRSENTVILAIRGTEGLGEGGGVDILADIDIDTVPFHGGASISSGIARLANLFLPEVIARLHRMPEVREVWVTGHSLGGAVAQAVGFALHVRPGVRVRRVVTFGAPRIGGAIHWAAVAKAAGFRLDYWVNAGDIVPRVPTVGQISPVPSSGLPVAWKHYGRLNYIDWADATVRFDDDKKLGPLINARAINFKDHAIIRYKHRIFDLMPGALRRSLISSLTADVSLGAVLGRARADLGADAPLTGLRALADAAPSLPAGDLLRGAALRFL